MIGKNKALDRRRVEGILQEDLLQVEAFLQKDPEKEHLGTMLRSAKDSLRKIQNLRIQGLKVRSKINWLESDDKGSKLFLRFLKEKGIKEHIEKIQVEGTTFTKQKDIIGHFFNFYKNLFSSENNREGCSQVRDLIKGPIPKKLEDSDANQLSKDISKEEI